MSDFDDFVYVINRNYGIFGEESDSIAGGIRKLDGSAVAHRRNTLLIDVERMICGNRIRITVEWCGKKRNVSVFCDNVEDSA